MTGITVGLAVHVGVLTPVGIDVTAGVVVGVAVGVDVAEGVTAEVGVALRVGVGDEGMPPNGVSVTYTGPAGEPPNRRTPGLPPPGAVSTIVVPLPSSNR